MAVTTSMASSGLAEVLDRILDKGLVIDAWVKVSVLGLELLTVEDDLERSFYEKQCLIERWSLRELKRQINSSLFHRIALSKNKKEVSTTEGQKLASSSPFFPARLAKIKDKINLIKRYMKEKDFVKF